MGLAKQRKKHVGIIHLEIKNLGGLINSALKYQEEWKS
jgi:hypothetical protein